MERSSANGLLVIERILRDREGIWEQIIEERELRGLAGQMLASSAASLAVYGLVLGASNGFAQALSSLVKLPLLFLATLAICLPTLYLFNLVFGARLSMMQAVTLILVSITVTSVLTLAFAPISLFFLISAHSYAFFKLLNVCILVLTAIVGLRFLVVGMRTLVEAQSAPAVVAVPEPQPQPELVAVAAPNGGTTPIHDLAPAPRPVPTPVHPPRSAVPPGRAVRDGRRGDAVLQGLRQRGPREDGRRPSAPHHRVLHRLAYRQGRDPGVPGQGHPVDEGHPHQLRLRARRRVQQDLRRRWRRGERGHGDDLAGRGRRGDGSEPVLPGPLQPADQVQEGQPERQGAHLGRRLGGDRRGSRRNRH